jgi:multiple sugar transport system ATP-binding protein
MNFIPVRVTAVDGGTVTITLPGGGTMRIPVSGPPPAAGAALTLGCRPEHVAMGKTDTAAGSLKGIVRVAEYLGSETMFYVTLDDGSEFSVKGGGLASQKAGDVLQLELPVAACHLFDDRSNTIQNGDLTR